MKKYIEKTADLSINRNLNVLRYLHVKPFTKNLK